MFFARLVFVFRRLFILFFVFSAIGGFRIFCSFRVLWEFGKFELEGVLRLFRLGFYRIDGEIEV